MGGAMKNFFALLLVVSLPAAAPADVAASRPLKISELQVPPGFDVTIYAQWGGHARLMAFSPSGILFVSDMNGGRILMIPRVGIVQTFASGLNLPHGLAFLDSDLYVAENARIIVFRGAGGASPVAGAPQGIAALPGPGGHATRTIVFAPDGKLVATAGSTCNLCAETDPRRAAAMRFHADGSGMELFAAGLRNSVGLAVHPATGEIWATDNGTDGLGDETPPDEINILRPGGDYGWPRCFGNGERYAPFTGDCSSTAYPELNLPAHSAPLGISFYTGSLFPVRYWDGAFVAFHGSWNRTQPTGYKVVYITAASGRAAGIEDFLTGFLAGGTASGRPVHAICGPDGALYVSDDRNGVIYRIGYNGPRLNPGGLVNAAAGVGSLSPGSLVSLYGVHLKAQAAQAASLPLPLSLDDVSVTVNGVRAPLLYAGPEQVNFQIPFGMQGQAAIALTNAAATDTLQAQLRAVSPAIFTLDQNGGGMGAITQAGDTITIYCTGLGEVNPPVAAGAAAPRGPLSQVVNPVTVTIDGLSQRAAFAGLAPDFAGLYQVNAGIPPAAGRGRPVTVVISAAGASSNPVRVVLQ